MYKSLYLYSTDIIKKYNPEVTGYSTGEGPVWFANARLNVAEPGDKSENMPGQADSLISKMKADKSFDFENDWKLVTIFIGGNDLCDYCDDTNTFSPENYVKNVQTALDKLHAEVPKVFVNLVEVLNIANPDNGETDLSFFSPDCFHLSLKGHEAAADALWNNMIEPVGKKRTTWTPDEPVECPDSGYARTSEIIGSENERRS
ncbi:hypothetical protein KUTeg_013738 [Tegillarca granosa]|uniref:Uncharacterized protein n=1 Tax=Tegillarca granosa TaxID=220873 RepID=A0ABQ9EUX6_TEGGR|nr:hypothetical protein KUTeg_013738 [Tegillarca granosa]